MSHRSAYLVQDISEEKDKECSRINNEVASINEILAMVKEFEKIVQNKAIFEVERKRLEKFRSTKDEIQTRFSETTPYTIQIFTDYGDVSNCLSKLFGKLTQKNKQIGRKMDAAVCCKTDLHKIKEEEPPNGFAKSKATSSMCSNHRSSDTEICSQQQKAQKHDKEQIMFCQESRCQIPIYTSFLKDIHKKHNICDLEEVAKQKCAALLEDIRLMKEILQKKKEDYAKV